MNPLQELTNLASRISAEGRTDTVIPALCILKSTSVTEPQALFYRPLLCLVLQGIKRTVIGNREFVYAAGEYFVASIDVPALGQTVKASSSEPYLALLFQVDPAKVTQVILDLPASSHPPLVSGFGVHKADDALVEAFLRMLRLLERPQEATFMGPLLEKEILYRLVQGPQGALFRQMSNADSRLSTIRMAVNWLRENLAKPILVEELSSLVGMSTSVFHRHFKAVTAMTPIQYQKQLRLHEARRLLVIGAGNTTEVASAVGYQSISQFTREYARFFGAPPTRDVGHLMNWKQRSGGD